MGKSLCKKLQTSEEFFFAFRCFRSAFNERQEICAELGRRIFHRLTRTAVCESRFEGIFANFAQNPTRFFLFPDKYKKQHKHESMITYPYINT